MIVYVDADACPVKDIIIEESKKYNLEVVLIRSYSHFSNLIEEEHVKTIYVDSENEAADYKIMKLVGKGDVVVTQDYGLASLLLAKQCTILHHKGFQYKPEKMDTLLNSRYASAMERKSGKRTKGPKAMTDQDREKFRQLFKKTISF
ncbi:YaiI/YqxD family protein [Piscibacillus sp. B03]|uniref:YaiI/YqxD family protein n=1 Tax=Piscibacillus sp. B03 TaxID=3457430 RepID=UPI003FCC652B